MKIRILAILFASMVLAAIGTAQNQSGSQSNQGSQSQASQGQTTTGNGQSQTTTGNSQNMSATVSHDRKSVTTDKDNQRYKVDNPDALAGKEDQHVALIVHVDPDNNMIHVIQVEPPPQ